MKAIPGLRLIGVGGWEALAAFIGPNGKLSPVTDCIARIAVVSDGKGVAEVLALAPPSEFLGSCLSDYDWLRRWNRLQVCHPEGSKRQGKASARIERLLARTLKEYLKDADPSAASAALENAFGRELTKWLDTSSIEDTKIVDERPKLEIIDMRPLDDDEQKRLSAQYPKWSAVIQDSGPATYCIEVEGQAIREETGSFWRRPRFLKGLGIACAVGLSGAVIAGAVFHLYRARADSLTPPELPSILDPLSVSTYTPSERPMPSSTPSEGQMPSSTPSDGQMPSSTPSEGQMPSSTPSQGQMPSSTPSEGPMPSFTTSRGLIYSETRSEAPMTTYTPITEATTHNYTSWYDAQFSRLSDVERYKYAVSCDCEAWSESDLVVNCKPVAIESRAGNIAMSAHELALLRIPSDTCKGIYDNNKNASMVDATADAWKTLDWSGCDLGGKVVCVDDRGEDLSCHYFNHPFKHDFPRVWEAVIRHLKPARCLLTNNADLDVRYIRNLARGRAAAKYITADIGGISDESLNALGLTLDWYYGTAACSGTYNDCQLPDCGCVEGRFSAEAVDPSGKDVVWGYVTDFFTTAEEMKGNYSLFQTPGYSPKFCKFECFNPDPETLEGYGNRVAEEYRINIGDRQARKHNCWSNVTA